MKISVVTTSVRPWDRLQMQLQDLMAQTFDDFEWIIKDDVRDRRPPVIPSAKFPIVYTPAGEGVVDYFAPALGQNTCLRYVQGELVFFMNDYVRMTPGVLARHWELYRQYGPKVVISGTMLQAEGHAPIAERKGDVELDSGVSEALGLESRAVWLYSSGRNDSAPLEELLDINGLDESFDGDRGGMDVDVAQRLMMNGCRFLVDAQTPCYDYPHHGAEFPWDKKLTMEGYWGAVGGGWRPKSVWANNKVNLKEVRANAVHS